jgi:hypothetical protein
MDDPTDLSDRKEAGRRVEILNAADAQDRMPPVEPLDILEP